MLKSNNKKDAAVVSRTGIRKDMILLAPDSDGYWVVV
jgi:hypothetical protein